MIGATLTLTGIPASVSVQIVRRRDIGAAARGSSVRASARRRTLRTEPRYLDEFTGLKN